MSTYDFLLSDAYYMIYLIFLISVLGLCAAWGLVRHVFSYDTGTKPMQEVASAIQEGAEAFLQSHGHSVAAG